MFVAMELKLSCNSWSYEGRLMKDALPEKYLLNFPKQHNIEIERKEFDVRLKQECRTWVMIFLFLPAARFSLGKPIQRWRKNILAGWWSERWTRIPTTAKEIVSLFVISPTGCPALYIGVVNKRRLPAFGFSLFLCWKMVWWTGIPWPEVLFYAWQQGYRWRTNESLLKNGGRILLYRKRTPPCSYERAIMASALMIIWSANNFILKQMLPAWQDIWTVKTKRKRWSKYGEEKWRSMRTFNDPIKFSGPMLMSFLISQSVSGAVERDWFNG